jgi:F0F1-type ATP synthase epsilon subunit
VVAVVDGGFLHVTGEQDVTRVDVLATFAELASEIDAHVAEMRLEEARRRFEQHRDHNADVDLQKALARVQATH